MKGMKSVACAVLLCASTTAMGVQYDWNGHGISGGVAGNDWFDPNNWLVDGSPPATAPTADDDVSIILNAFTTWINGYDGPMPIYEPSVIIGTGAVARNVHLQGFTSTAAPNPDDPNITDYHHRVIDVTGNASFSTLSIADGGQRCPNLLIRNGVTISLSGGSAETPTLKTRTPYSVYPSWWSDGTIEATAANVYFDCQAHQAGTISVLDPNAVVDFAGNAFDMTGNERNTYVPYKGYHPYACETSLRLSEGQTIVNLPEIHGTRWRVGTSSASGLLGLDDVLLSGFSYSSADTFAIAGGSYLAMDFRTGSGGGGTPGFRLDGPVTLKGAFDANGIDYALALHTAYNRNFNGNLNGQTLTVETTGIVQIGNPEALPEDTGVHSLNVSGSTLDVAGDLRVGLKGAMVGDAGSVVRVGGNFVNAATNNTAFDLSAASVEFQDLGGGNALPGPPHQLEVAGKDLGPHDGWSENFGLGTLTVNANVELADDNDNQPDWEGSEALYLGTLSIVAGGKFEASGLNVYYLNGGDPKQFFPADANLDGMVNVADLGILGANYKQTGKDWSSGDFNGDGLINVADLGILGANYRSQTPPPPGAVPEPASAVLMLAGTLGCLMRRRARRR